MQRYFSEIPDSCFRVPSTKSLFTDKCLITFADETDLSSGLLDLKIFSLVSPSMCTANIRIGKINKKATIRLGVTNSEIELGNNISGHWFIASHQNSKIRIGDDTSANNGVDIAVKVLAEPDSSVDFGKDCMFSDGITIQCGGQHSIICLKNREILTHKISSIRIEDHCWVGRDATLVSSSKEILVGAGSIIATRAVVTKSVPNCCIAAGKINGVRLD